MSAPSVPRREVYPRAPRARGNQSKTNRNGGEGLETDEVCDTEEGAQQWQESVASNCASPGPPADGQRDALALDRVQLKVPVAQALCEACKEGLRGLAANVSIVKVESCHVRWAVDSFGVCSSL